MTALPLLAMLFFAVIHSLMATMGFKNRIAALVGRRVYEGFYRLFYNVVSVIIFLPVPLAIILSPSTILWHIPAPWVFLGALVQVASIIALLAALLQTDVLRFAGIRQALAYLNGEPLPLPPEKLQTSGMYALVRHPLYLFGLFILWPVPVMSDTYLSFAAAATLYLFIGSRLEERRLLAEHGASYHAYRERVPWMLPWPRPVTPRANENMP